ncbi:hypothetical protein H2203_002549 [Taxawa tesnikishii (nom. ined.)]|nr:hypothetical protein H2203_002549 [Dothideales sp. JES 119]
MGHFATAEEQYLIRHGTSVDEVKKIWWPFMLNLGWVFILPHQPFSCPSSADTFRQNRSSYDLATYMDASKSKMLVVLPRSTNEPVGHIQATIYDNKTGWVAMFIVEQACRGLGYGRALFETAMDEFTRNGTKYVGLDGVAEQKKTYERRGFVESQLGLVKCMYRNLTSHAPLVAAGRSLGLPKDTELCALSMVPNRLLVQSDLAHTGFERNGLWTEEFFNRPDVFGSALMRERCTRSRRSTVGKLDDVLAWVVVRRSVQGYRIGPLYAKDTESARIVLTSAMEDAGPGRMNSTPLDNETPYDKDVEEISEKAQLAVEIWSGNPAAEALFTELGWQFLGVDYHRMWLGGEATPEQSEGGLAHKGMFAVFDAAIG